MIDALVYVLSMIWPQMSMPLLPKAELLRRWIATFSMLTMTEISTGFRQICPIRSLKRCLADALRIENELALCFNRADINPEYMKTLIMAAAAERYAGLNDPTPAHRRALLRQKLELEPENEETLWELFESAVTHVCIGKGGEISLSQKDQKECAS